MIARPLERAGYVDANTGYFKANIAVKSWVDQACDHVAPGLLSPAQGSGGIAGRARMDQVGSAFERGKVLAIPVPTSAKAAKVFSLQ